METSEKIKWFVATYGDLGLEVEFFSNEEKLKDAVREAEEGHKNGDFDSYTWGDVE